MCKIVIRRTNKELEYFNKKIYVKDNIVNKLKELYDNLYFIQYENKDIYHIVIKCKKTETEIIDIMYPYNYPFNAYSIYKYNLNKDKINYNVYLSNIISKKLKKCSIEYIILLNYLYNSLYSKSSLFLKDYNFNECLCCKSLTCNNNWVPSLTINDLILEYYEVLFINEQCSMKNYILNNCIKKKILDFYLKGNNDMYEYIMNFNLYKR